MKRLYMLLVAMFLLALLGCSGLQMDAAKSSQRFIVGKGAEENCVTDTRTGLMWARNGNLGDGDWVQAMDTIARLNNSYFCDHKNWRLPTRSELRTLINRSQPSTAHWLNTQGFTNVQANYYWTSDTRGVGSGEAWIVYLLDGLETYFPIRNPYNVLPVRKIR